MTSELLFTTDGVRERYITLMERHHIPREFWGVGGESSPTHCSCGRRWTRWHNWEKRPNVCRPCDKLRPVFDSDHGELLNPVGASLGVRPVYAEEIAALRGPNEEDDPETTHGGWYD